MAERRARLRPLFEQLGDGRGGSTFLDLCEMISMFEEKIPNTEMEWKTGRVTVRIGRVPKKRRAST